MASALCAIDKATISANMSNRLSEAIIDAYKITKGKAIVYFIVSKLNNIYENLPAQAKGDDRVELRHFTIIDEAHYMLDFENKPLKELIAVGRNKGLSVILATQNMDSYKSR